MGQLIWISNFMGHDLCWPDELWPGHLFTIFVTGQFYDMKPASGSLSMFLLSDIS